MFDTASTITLGGMRTTAGKADITVRWPSDDEWVGHRKRRKVIQTQLGRGISETNVDTADADAKLYEAIKVNGAPPLTVGESTFIIDLVQHCDVKGVDLGADDAEVELEILAGQRVKHRLGIPTMDQVRTFQRATRIISLPFNRVELRASLEAAARLWDECRGRAEGYAGAVPNIHKDVAIRAVLQAVEDEAKPRNDESNF